MCCRIVRTFHACQQAQDGDLSSQAKNLDLALASHINSPV